MPTLSIVVPTLNEEEYLPHFFASLKQQTLQPMEVIIADAGSTDRTAKIARTFGAKVVEGGMPGPGRNRGAEVAKGDLIFFFDADVELQDKKFLEKALKEFEDRNLDIATADVRPIEGNKFDDVSHKIYNKYVRMVGKFKPHAPGFCLLVRKELHKKLKGFDESVVFAEDQEYTQRGNKIGAFGFLSKDITIPVSTRRQDRDGRFNMAVKYILGEVHMWIFGPIRHNLFNYSFGHNKKK